MSGIAHESRRDEIAAYLLEALDSEEAASLERHLATGCVECRAEMRWLEPAVRVLPECVDRVEAPAGLRQRLLEEARADLEPEAPRQRERRPLFAGWRPLAGLAAVALIAAAVAGFAIGGGRSSGGAGDMTVVAGRPPGVTAKVLGSGDSATVLLANVEELPPDRVLEAWVKRNGEVEPAGLFVPDRKGRAMTAIPKMRGVEMVMVTLEPRSGSAAPTSAPMVTARIESG